MIRNRTAGSYRLPFGRYPSSLAPDGIPVLYISSDDITIAYLKDGHVWHALGGPAYLRELPSDDALHALQLTPECTREELERELGVAGRGNTFCLIHDGAPSHIVSYDLFTLNADDTLTHLSIRAGCMGRFDDTKSNVLSVEWSRHGAKTANIIEQSPASLKAAPEE